MGTIIASIQVAKKTAAAWSLQNPVLKSGQVAVETNGGLFRMKIGDGATAYNGLPYLTVDNSDSVIEGVTNLYFSNDRVTAHADTLYYRKSAVDGMFADFVKSPLPIDCSANPNYPAATKGTSYKVSAAGKIGGAAGVIVEVGDLLIASVNTASGNHATVGANWGIYQTNIDKSTELVYGTSRRATSSEANAGTDDEAYVTSAKVRNAGDARYSQIGHSHQFSAITDKPTTLAGYGISDAASSSHSHAFSAITSKPTTLAGYGISDALQAANPTFSGTMNGGNINLGTSGLRNAKLGVNGAISQNVFYHANFSFGSGNATSFAFNVGDYAPNVAITGNALAVNIQFITWVSGTAAGFYQYSIISSGSSATVSLINANTVGSAGSISVSAVRTSGNLEITITGSLSFQCQGYGVALSD